MSSAVAHTSSHDRIFQRAEWDIKQLVAILENATLDDIMKVMKVSPIKWKTSDRTSRFTMDITQNFPQFRLDSEGGVVVRRVNVSEPLSELAEFISSSIDDEQVQSLLETTLKLKVLENVRKISDKNIELNLAPRSLRDQIEELALKSNSCFYLIDLGVLMNKYINWRKSIPRVQPFYAVKSNPDMEICITLFCLGSGFDCASKAELEQITSIPGIDVDKIIFANPCKQIEHIKYAKEVGVKMMTFDNPFELEKISKYYPESHLVLRLLPDDSMSMIPFGSKFGASFVDSIMLIEKCFQLNLNLIGVSFHVGSGCFSPVAWVEALKIARSIFDEAAKFGYKMDFVDIGGGFPGTEMGALNLGMIGAAINPVIDLLFPPYVHIISEPGRYFSTEVSSLACNIVSKRERVPNGAGSTENDREIQYYLSDGIYGSMNCIVFDHAVLEPILLSSDINDRSMVKTTMWGPTCDSIDLICKDIQFPESHVDEWIYFKNMGAYTSAAASKFNGFNPPPSHYTLNVFTDI